MKNPATESCFVLPLEIQNSLNLDLIYLYLYSSLKGTFSRFSNLTDIFSIISVFLTVTCFINLHYHPLYLFTGSSIYALLEILAIWQMFCTFRMTLANRLVHFNAMLQHKQDMT